MALLSVFKKLLGKGKSPSPALPDEATQLRERLAALQVQCDQAMQQLADTRRQLDALGREHTASTAQATSLKQQLADARRQLERLADYDDLHDTVQSLQRQLDNAMQMNKAEELGHQAAQQQLKQQLQAAQVALQESDQKLSQTRMHFENALAQQVQRNNALTHRNIDLSRQLEQAVKRLEQQQG